MTTAIRSDEPAPDQARARLGERLDVPASDWCPGFTQVDLISVPVGRAYDMLLFCRRKNPKPCQVLDITDQGTWNTPSTPGADRRTGVPRYRVREHGRVTDEPLNIVDRRRDDLVTFLIGRTFTFESAPAEEGVPLRHVEQERTVAMHQTPPCLPPRTCRGPSGAGHREPRTPGLTGEAFA